MSSNRVLKKVSTPFEQLTPTGAILVVNLVDPQLRTMEAFLDATRLYGLPTIIVANKADVAPAEHRARVAAAIPGDVVAASMTTGEGLTDILDQLRHRFTAGDRIAVLGVFNSGKTSLIARLTNAELATGDLPGTTLEFTEHAFGDLTLIDTVGQIIDIHKPLMVSIDLDDCATSRERFQRVLRQDAEAILACLDSSMDGLDAAAVAIRKAVDRGGKLVVVGAGASALVAMEIAGQGLETGLPVLAFTNNLADAQPVSFSKGTAEDEGALARYITMSVQPHDVVLGVSASGGTGFVYDTLGRAQTLGATTVALTENADTPLGHAADIVIKSEAKPEGPSSSKIQVAHLAIGHALVLALAAERGITAEQSIEFMLPEPVATKKMGLK